MGFSRAVIFAAPAAKCCRTRSQREFKCPLLPTTPGALSGQSISADEVRKMDLSPRVITAAMIGLKSKLATVKVQRAINNYEEEPLSAIMPGIALQELWGLIGTAESALAAVSAMVMATANENGLSRHVTELAVQTGRNRDHLPWWLASRRVLGSSLFAGTVLSAEGLWSHSF